MSNIALSWAFKCHVGNASAKAVLVYLADRADDDGTAAYPKIATIVNVTEHSPGTRLHPPWRPTVRAPRQGRQEPSAPVLPDRVGPRGRIRPVDPRMDQGDAHGGTRPEDHGQYRGPRRLHHHGKRRIQGRAAGKRWNEADSQHCKSRRAGKRAGTGTANPAGPALRELHPQHCKCRTPSTANLAELYI